MIVKSEEAKRRTFLGVDFVVLSHGPETMITKMLYKKEDNVPFHKHPNEQSGYVISGKYKITFGGEEQVIGPGDSYSIPAMSNIALTSSNPVKSWTSSALRERTICKKPELCQKSGGVRKRDGVRS